MLLNLWDNDGIYQSFMELYDITNSQMCNIIKRLFNNAGEDNIKVFCEETGIKLDAVDVAHSVEFLGKIVSTTVDDFEHLRRNGLVTVDVLLETDSPMSQHLKRYQIEIKPSTHELIYKGKRFYIPSYNENCQWCAYGDKQCRYAKQKYKNMYCSYLKAVSSLAVKLYEDNSEIEMFLTATEDEMLDYSTVKKYPEIFWTIEDFVNEWFRENLTIGAEWAKLKQHTYIVTLLIKYDELSYCNGYTCGNDGTDASEIFWRYEEFCTKTYDCTEQVPKCFWDNVWLLDVCLNSICPFNGAVKCICAGIKHDVKIPFNKLKIELV